MHKKKYRKNGRWKFIFDVFSQRTLFCFLFVFARLTITSLIYYMLIQDHNLDQGTPSFGFCFIPNCVRMIILFCCLQICNLGIIFADDFLQRIQNEFDAVVNVRCFGDICGSMCMKMKLFCMWIVKKVLLWMWKEELHTHKNWVVI